MHKKMANAISEEIIAFLQENRPASRYVEISPATKQLSINFFKMPVMRVKCGSRKKFIAINPLLEKALNGFSSLPTEKIKTDPWIRVIIESIDDIRQMEPLFLRFYDDAYILTAEEIFDCCSRYLECSGAKECIQPDYLLARGCKYRLHLANGRVFFGKNKTV